MPEPPSLAELERMEWLRQELPRVVADLKCPDCGAEMVLRIGRYGRFYGCSRFKADGCKGSVTARADGTPAGIPGNARVRALRHQVMEYMQNHRSGGAAGWPVENPDWPDGGVGTWGEDDCFRVLKLLGLAPVVSPVPPRTVWERLSDAEDPFGD